MEVNEKDWKFFRESLPKWQERYMEKLVEEYIEILKKDGSASDKYWALEGRIKADKRNPGVVITDIKRSNFYIHMSSLLRYKVITVDDLSDFSVETREALRIMALFYDWNKIRHSNSHSFWFSKARGTHII